MIKHFCDVCGDEIKGRNTSGDGPTTNRLKAEIKGNVVYSVEVMHTLNGVHNRGDICKYCILNALWTLDDRLQVAPSTKFNVNNCVKVRLTDHGRKIHRLNHDALFANWPANRKPEYVAPSEDADGWSLWQFHELMHEFGHATLNSSPNCFETEIDLLVAQS